MQKLHRHRGADPEDERSFGAGRLADLRLAECRWWLDSPVFNSGRLKGIILGVAAETGWPWQVELVTNPDRVLSGAEQIVSYRVRITSFWIAVRSGLTSLGK